MKKSVFGLFTLIILGALPAMAVDLKIATVDLQKALETAEAGRTAKSELEKDFTKRQKELQKEEEKLRKAGEEFQKQSLVMAEAARATKQAELQKRAIELQQQMVQSQQEIQKKQQELTEPIIIGLRDAIKELADKKGYTLVLEKSRQGVLYSQDKDDLTEEVIKAFNEKKKKK